MKIRKAFGLIFMFVFVASMFMGTNVAAVNGDNSGSALMATRYCTITSPADGSTVSGVVTINIDAYRTAKLYIDGVNLGRVSTYNWDTTAVADGIHTIYAKAPGISDTITVTVSNGGSTNSPPVVTINSPSNGATVSGTTTISVSVTDEDTLVPDIFIDDIYITTAYTYDWDTTGYSDGSHTVYAVATDSEALTGSDLNTVTVDNSGSSQGW
ncbi:MAG: Ig-like domain-containing protein, partial [Candidatus Thorarchaeota archaeon]